MIKHLAIQIALVLAVTSQFSSVAAHQTKFDGKVTADGKLIFLFTYFKRKPFVQLMPFVIRGTLTCFIFWLL